MSATRLALPAVFGWVCLAIFIGAPEAIPWAAAACWVLAAVLLIAAVAYRLQRRRGPLLVAVLCAAAAALMLSSAGGALDARRLGALEDSAASGALIRATAELTQTIHDDATRFRAVLRHGIVGGTPFHGQVPVLAFGNAEHPAAIGSELQVVGTVSATDPGQSDVFLLYLSADAQVVRGPPWYLSWAHTLRLGLLDTATALPGDGGRLLPGLAVGDTSAVGDTLDRDMKRSSLSHLTAVSGANCAVVIALVFVTASALGLPRSWRIGAAIAMLVGFVVLVTPEPSVLRAAVMAILVLATMGSGRPVRGVPVLSLAVLVLLVVDPWLARSYGFTLSVCATAGLLLLAEPIARRLTKWMPYPLALVIAVPAAAQLACQPVLILLAPALPGYGVVANVLAGPAAPAATVLGLGACVLLPWAPALGQAVSLLAWLPSAWIAAVASFFSTLPGSQLPWPADGWGVALAAALVALVVAVTVGRGAAALRLRVGASVVLAVACACYLGAISGDQLRRRLSPPSDWVIAACDVGQGDAVLVRNGGEVALIDTGAEPALLAECLDVLAVGHLNLLVLTHFDLDHVGGADAVTGRVDRVLVGPSSGSQDDALVQRLAAAGAEVEQVVRGRAGELGALRWQVLWPPERLEPFSPGNDASVVLAFADAGTCTQGCVSSVFLGDLGEQSQNRMLAAGGAQHLRAVDVVKVAHHGSRDQSARLYSRLYAGLGIIGVGSDNTYGHPTDHALSLLASTNTAVARTDQYGMVLVSVRDGVTYLWTEHSGDVSAE